MTLELHWEQIALRLLLAAVASFVIGLNRDEEGHPAGVRTTMLVCLAAALVMVQVNLLLPTAGKSQSSFVQLDLMRLPLGILSGIGFLGAGVILKRENGVTGVTTAATMWFVTVLGLLFGGGQLVLGSSATVGGVAVLWGLKKMESHLATQHRASLSLQLSAGAPPEAELRERVQADGCRIKSWKTHYEPATVLASLECTLEWRDRASRSPKTPETVEHLRKLPGVVSVSWQE